MPEFEYDPKKSLKNLRKHGVDFDDAQDLWLQRHLLLDAREVAGEKRYAIVGRLRGRAWESIYASFFEEPKA